MAFNAIPAFNNQISFATAFGFTRDEIHTFLRNVANNPGGYRERDPVNPTQPYPDPDPQRRAQDLRLLRDEIIALTPPAGAKYLTPLPRQSILRTATNQLAPTQNPIPWPVTTREERFYIIFDLLGIFLSIIGPAPTRGTTPTARNFFLLLVVVYGRWCYTLIGGSGFAPTVAQVTWARRTANEPWSFFLGASAKGWAQPPPPNPLMLPAKQRRHQYMYRLLENMYQVWNRSPVFTAMGGPPRGWNFGNCGETYPFLYLVNAGVPANNIFGIALNIADTETKRNDWQLYWANGPIKPPCANCSYVLARYNTPRANFVAYQNP